MYDLSVIIPVYNLQNYIGKCLDSLLVQEKDIKYSYEIICINDGSTDSSESILSYYSNEYSDIMSVYNTENSGVSSARNLGINHAMGKYITFVDGDDWVPSYFVHSLLERLYDEDADLAIGYTMHVFKKGEKLVEERANNLIFNTENHVAGKAVKRSIVEKYKIKFPADIKVGEDLTFLFSYIMCAEKYIIIPESLYYYRRNRYGSAMSNNFNNENYLDIYKACSRLIRFAKDTMCFMQFKEELEYLLIKNIIARTLPKVIFNNILNHKRTNLLIDQQYAFVESYFPNWYNNRFFKEDIEGYFLENVGKNYYRNLIGLKNKRVSFLFSILFDKFLSEIGKKCN